MTREIYLRIFFPIFVAASAGILMLTSNNDQHVAVAQSTQDCVARDYLPTDVLAISEIPIPSRPSIQSVITTPYTFLTNVHSLKAYGGELVCVSSSKTKLEDLWVDDELRFLVTRADRKSATWLWDFICGDGQRICKLKSQDLSWMFTPGEYRIDVQLRDTKFGGYGASALFLLVWHRPYPVISSPKPTEVLSLASGESITVTASLEGKPSSALFESAQVEIKRTDGRQLKLDMVLFGDRAIVKYTPELPDQPTAQVEASLVVLAKARHDGAIYDTRSDPITATIKMRPGITHAFTLIDFGSVFEMLDLTSVRGTVKIRGIEQASLKAAIPELPWLRVRVEPEILRADSDNLVILTPELQGPEPQAGRAYTGTLTLKANPDIEVLYNKIPLRFELRKPQIRHDLPKADFGSVNDLEAVRALTPITFGVTPNLRAPGSLTARLIGEDGMENDKVRLVLSPNTIPATGTVSISIGLVSIDSASGTNLLSGLNIQGKLEISAGPGIAVEPKEPVAFRLYVRSKLETTVLALLNLSQYCLGGLTILLSIWALAELAWFGWHYLGGSIPEGTLRLVSTEADGKIVDVIVPSASALLRLSKFNKPQQRLFGVLFADQNTPPYYEDENEIDKRLGPFWAKFLRATTPDEQIAVESPQKKKNPSSAMSSRVRLVGSNGTLRLVNMDEQCPAWYIREGTRAATVRSSPKKILVPSKKSVELKDNDILCFPRKMYRYRKA